MSNETLVKMTPPGDPPSVLQLAGEQIMPSEDGTFTVTAKFIPQLLAAGWSIVVPSGTTRVP